MERSGGLKIRRKVNCEQNVPGKLKGAQKTQKTIPIEVKMGAKAGAFFTYFSLGGPMLGHRGAEISKNLLLVRRINKM